MSINDVASIQEIAEFLVERTLENKQVSVSHLKAKDQIIIEVAGYPKGINPARVVLDALYDWAEKEGLDNVTEKIIELEESDKIEY